MSRLTKQQEGLLNLQLQHTPEFRTGLYESEPQLGFDDVFSQPVGPLYNVNYVPGSENYFEGPENQFESSGTAGPLRHIDVDRTVGILQALEANDPTGELVENYMSTIRETDAGDPYQVVQSTPTKYAEHQYKDDFDLTPRMDISTVPAQERDGTINYGYTYGPTQDSENLPQTGKVYINPDLAKYITTAPTSPANQLPIYDIEAAKLGMYGEKPEDLMRKAVDTIQHEYAHNILDLPGFGKIKKSAINAPMPSNLKLKGPPTFDDRKDHTNEEIFNRAIDIERYYRQYGNINDPSATIDLDYIQQILDNKYQNPTDTRWGSALSYINSMRPQVLSYFDEIDRQGKMGWINKQKTKRGMPEHLGDAGQSLDDMSGVGKSPTPISVPVPAHISGGAERGVGKSPTPISVPVPAHISGGGGPSRGRDRGRSRGRGETGQIAGGHHFSRGGLMDIPLPGRSRDI